MGRRLARDLAGIVLICAALQACANRSPLIGARTEPRALAPAPLAEPEVGSGRTEVGKASYYAPKFSGRKTASGQTYSLEGNAAASKTLPLGSAAKVTDLNTGKSAIVKVEDRGPHVKGRIIDVSPKVAEKLDMKHAGVARVAVKPLAGPHQHTAATPGAAEVSPTK